MIIPVFKPLGASSHQLAASIGKARGEKATHTGTLDPMAEGVLVVLTGEDRFKKSELADTKKTYDFSMLIGVSTDSHDLLGLSTKIADKLASLEEIVERMTTILPDFTGQQTQEQPLFSAGRKDGKSLFEFGAEGQEVDTLPTNTITISSLDILTVQVLPLAQIEREITQKIACVTGNFRQEAILSDWKKTLKTLKSNAITQLPHITFRTTVSKRTYIRGIVRDLAKKLDIAATTFTLNRIQNGPYTLADCKNTQPHGV